MNRIKAASFQTKFASGPHLTICVDGKPLDQLLDASCPGYGLIGLVPTWLDWMSNDAEQEVAFARMELPARGRIRVPLLTCPDDLDFGCTLVIADLLASDTVVEWTRLGLDRTESVDPHSVGSEVIWFEELAPMCFGRTEYDACLEVFRAAGNKRA